MLAVHRVSAQFERDKLHPSGGGEIKSKAACQRIVDGCMTLALFFLMAYHFWGQAPHEWVGVGMFVLFIAHHVLNARWHKNLFRGRYSAMRIRMLCIDCLVLISMLVQMYSGLVMSRYAFGFLPISGGMATARRLHILGAYWGFLLMGLHIGLHTNLLLGSLRKGTPRKQPSQARCALASLAALLIAGYGVFALIKRNFVSYLFLQSEFVFFDYDESKILFYVDYLAILGLCIVVAHYGSKLCKSIARNRSKRT